ncbi:hypothetical protein, partial [Pseudomonas syringae group genomosp. 7]|uniref:hypothetical protein n=1 Tax=Pseudomonas syringae group genomosp. 7 TaxID=251699 RepID=UPI00376F5FED
MANGTDEISHEREKLPGHEIYHTTIKPAHFDNDIKAGVLSLDSLHFDSQIIPRAFGLSKQLFHTANEFKNALKINNLHA